MPIRYLILLLLLFPASLLAQDADPFLDDEALVLEVRLGNRTLSDSLIAYEREKILFLPLGGMAGLLGFPIGIDPDRRRADGWIMAEDREFHLDLDDGKVTVDGRETTLDAESVRAGADDIYVDSALLARWFPAGITLSPLDQSLSIVSREPLPVEQAELRAAMRGAGSEDGAPPYPPYAEPYAWASWPYADVTLNAGHDRTRGFVPGGHIAASGDLAKMSAQAYVSGDGEGGLSDARLRLGRKDPEGGALGNAAGLSGVREFAIGDISSRPLPLSSESAQGAGAMLSSFPLERLETENRVTLRGDLPPGWEAELYRNNTLLDFRQAGGDGRYLFEDIPLLPGVNVLRLVFHGPFGERREETQRFLAGAGQAAPGKSYYGLSVMQNRRDLFPVDDQSGATVAEGEPRVTASYQYGVAERLALSGHLARVPLEDGAAHDYLTLSYAGRRVRYRQRHRAGACFA